MKRTHLLLTLFLALPLTGSLATANWPQWRGPTGNGVADAAANPPLEWGEQKNIKWKAAIPGAGHSTPVIWGDKVFILTAVPGESRAAAPASSAPPDRGRGGRGQGQAPTTEYAFSILCLDRATGSVVWEQVAKREVPHEGHHQTNTYASGSPVTDGEHVYAFFSSQGLYCYDLYGKLIWKKEFGKMRTRNGFGEGVSPTLAGDKIIVVWDTEEESWIAALDKKTGEELWKVDRDERTGWSTPRIVEYDGQHQVVVNGTTAVRCYEVDTGKLLWECSGQTANAIPSIVAKDNVIYVMSGFRGSAAYAIELGGQGDISGTDKVKWTLDRGTPYVPSPLLYDGLLYFLQGNEGRLSVVDAATGKVHFQQERLDGVRGVYASPVGAAGRVYISSREGNTVVLDKGTELKVLAENKLDDPIDASPVVIGDELFLRTHTHLYCIAE